MLPVVEKEDEEAENNSMLRIKYSTLFDAQISKRSLII